MVIVFGSVAEGDLRKAVIMDANTYKELKSILINMDETYYQAAQREFPEFLERAVSPPSVGQSPDQDQALLTTTRPHIELKNTATDVGGINLDPALLDLQIKRDGKGIPLPLQQQPSGDMQIDGFLPIIIKVTPINVPLFLGFSDEKTPSDSAQEKDRMNLSGDGFSPWRCDTVALISNFFYPHPSLPQSGGGVGSIGVKLRKFFRT